ncbi:MAG: hypothetical protein A2W31_03510 [Planctomycetes bacterium RBG_16_64_10]|nr:MAG: hypothetical protein A2W31_03510 [Planctomycetes bacterium RBG_16_64_10]
MTESHVRWTADAGLPDTCGPLVAGPLVLLLASYGTLTCYDGAEGGEPLWETDFEDSFRSSPSLVGTRIYLFGESGKSWVVEPSRTQCQQVAQGDLGESCVTSPAFQDGRMYIRGAKHLFCISTP